VDENVGFLGSDQNSDEPHCHQILKNFLSSNDIECMDPYMNLANDVTEEVVFLHSGQKTEDSFVSNP